MGPAIGDILPLAVGVAVSPLPIVAIILMLFSKRAKSNGPAFVLGWMAGIIVVGGIVLALGNTADISSGGGPGTATSVLRLVLGLLLVGVAVRNWRRADRGARTACWRAWFREGDAAIERAGWPDRPDTPPRLRARGGKGYYTGAGV